LKAVVATLEPDCRPSVLRVLRPLSGVSPSHLPERPPEPATFARPGTLASTDRDMRPTGLPRAVSAERPHETRNSPRMNAERLSELRALCKRVDDLRGFL